MKVGKCRRMKVVSNGLRENIRWMMGIYNCEILRVTWGMMMTRGSG